MKISIQKALSLISVHLKVKYYLHDRFLTFDEVFAETGMLPALTKRAEQLSSLCLGYGLGTTYEEAEGSLTGKRVIFDDLTPNSVRLLCIVDVIHELIQGSPSADYTQLDELMYD